jgi:16S rRNA processing protein RimM
VELHTSFPERFAERRHLSALGPDGARREVEVEDAWAHKGRMVLKLAGVENISQAEALTGCELQIRRSERVPLESGAAYVSDLIGCVLWARQGEAESKEVGRIIAVQFGAGDAPLLVVESAAGERLVPLAAEYLTGAGVDVAARRVEMALPEGMLELAAPAGKKPKAGRPKR